MVISITVICVYQWDWDGSVAQHLQQLVIDVSDTASTTSTKTFHFFFCQ